MNELLKIADFQGDSKSLKEIDGKPITIVKVERSDYDDSLGVKLTIKEDYDGTVFHTTRKAITSKFYKPDSNGNIVETKLTASINTGNYIHCITEKVKSNNPKVNDYYVLKDVESKPKQESLA